MDILKRLPDVLQTKIKYYVLEHPCARLIRDEIERLHCDKSYRIKMYGQVVAKIHGINYFCSEYFLQFKSSSESEVSSITSELFQAMFNPSSTSDDEDDDDLDDEF